VTERMILRSQIVGSGCYLPSRIVTNSELAAKVDTSDEWIIERTGIRQRHIAAEGETTSDLATAAASAALKSAGLTGADVDLLVVATATPDNTFPATAARVQSRLGMTGGAAFDVQAVCSGFIYALAVADNFIKAEQARTAVVIGAETFSRILDWEDRGTCVLFGDGVRGGGAARVVGKRAATRIVASCPPTCIPMVAITTCFMWMAARLRRRPSAICVWKARKCSVMR